MADLDLNALADAFEFAMLLAVAAPVLIAFAMVVTEMKDAAHGGTFDDDWGV